VAHETHRVWSDPHQVACLVGSVTARDLDATPIHLLSYDSIISRVAEDPVARWRMVKASNPDWESLGGHYRVRLENNWIDVPDDAVSPTEPGGAHDCMADASWQSNLDPLLHTGKYDLEIISVRPIKMIGLIDRRTVRILVTP
jgi:hypothetical protein